MIAGLTEDEIGKEEGEREYVAESREGTDVEDGGGDAEIGAE